MRVSRKNSNYMDKNKIIFVFNQSVSNFNAYCRRPADDESYETLSLLNEAGEKLYESFEAAIKNTLVKHFRKKQIEGIISWSEYSNEKRKIEEMNRDSLIRMQADENPIPFHAVIIEYNTIQRNAYHVTNAKKHKQQNVFKDKYCEVLPEIRKYISAYVDSSADLMMDNPEGEFIAMQALTLFSETKYFESTGKYGYVLLTDAVSDLSETQKRALIYIKWSMVLDLDSNSNDNGLAAAFFNQNKIQTSRFTPEHPDKTQFNRFSTTPYWFYLNGISGLPATLTDGSIRNWNQKYASILYIAFQRYHATFEKKIKVVILSNDTDRVSRIVEALDSVYEDDVRFLLLSTNHPALSEKYNTLIIKLSVDEFARSILANKSFFNNDSLSYACMMPSKDGTMVSVVPEKFNHFELVHQNIADEDAKIEARTLSELFYQGREQLSWYGAKQGFAVLRNEIIQRFKKYITDMDNSYGFFTVYHDAGMGGSTFARNLAYDMRLDNPTCILRQYIKETTAIQLSNLYKELRSSIIVFIDQSLLSPDQVLALENEIKPLAFPFVIIYSCRKRFREKKPSDITIFNDFEFDEMVKRLTPFTVPATLDIFKNIKSAPSRRTDRSPFIMSLYTFEENFVGVGPYIHTFLKDMTEGQKEILVYLSLADYYANKPINEGFFSRSLISSEKDDSLWTESSIFDDLVVLLPQDGLGVYKIRHPLFAKEIIDQMIYKDQEGNDLANEACASSLINWLVKFIKYSKTNTVVDYDATLDVLRNLFIVRNGQDLNRDRFSPLIQKVKKICSATRDGNNRAGMVFKTLVEVYPEDAHFLAHLSRFYTYVEKNYDKGVELAHDAIELSEYSETEKDPILCHIYGMSLKLQIRDEYKKRALECHEQGDLLSEEKWIQRIINNTELALAEFEISRAASNQNAGYQAAIDLCIMVLDFAKSLSGEEETSDFIAKNPAAWYMKYLDEAEGLMKAWKNEDTSFYQLQDKINVFYGDIDCLERTITMWKSALDHAKPEEEIQRRRLLARAKQRKLDIIGYENASQQDIDEIINLAELNIDKEPKNSANIRLWFEMVRYCLSKNPEILLDEVLDKLSVWKEASGNLEAYYYYFICNCIKAIDGSSRAEAEIPILQSDLKNRSAKRYDNRYIYEWLGKGKGLNRLEHFSPTKITRQEEKTLEILTGYIEKFKNPGNATIRSHNMEVFFNPKRARQAFSQDSEGTRVSFAIGFSYDGLRAYDQSVIEVAGEGAAVSFPIGLNKVKIGSRVKCRVTRKLEFYIQAKLVDYNEQNGSVHINELGEDYSAGNRPPQGKMFFATVIGPKVNGFWQLSLKDT